MKLPVTNKSPASNTLSDPIPTASTQNKKKKKKKSKDQPPSISPSKNNNYTQPNNTTTRDSFTNTPKLLQQQHQPIQYQHRQVNQLLTLSLQTLSPSSLSSISLPFPLSPTLKTWKTLSGNNSKKWKQERWTCRKKSMRC